MIPWQAKDINASDIQAAIECVIRCKSTPTQPWTIGASRWEIHEFFPNVPEKVLLAKLSKMVRRGKLMGCACGCRGDFNVALASRPQEPHP